MGRIVQLSKNVINQIAAGEVIERPFSVIKELVENSVDAGATKISIEVSNECRDLRVADNGCGIYPEDILLAFSKHATSKISGTDDLYNISTLGFRGEALASIISISKLTCTTRTGEFDYGTKVECQNSEVKQLQTGCAIGTIMDIRDLFYNIPARLKFLKSSKTEFAYINDYIQTLAIIHPNISFELKFNGKEMFKTISQTSQLDTIKSIFSDEVTTKLKPIEYTDKLSNLKITGFVSSPDYTRASKKDYYLYVNSRPVKCPVMQKAIDMVFRNLIGNTRYPFIILNLEIPACDIDVNVHPTKKEIKYKNPNQIFSFVYTSIDSALKGVNGVNGVNQIIKTNEPDDKTDRAFFEHNDFVGNKKTDDIAADMQQTIELSQNKTFDLKPENVTVNYAKPQILYNKPVESIYANNFVKQERFIETSPFQNEDIIIGQYKKTYIIIEKENGLEIVDQHIADERYIYEHLKKSRNIDCQLLFISDVIEISNIEKDLLQNNKDKLSKYGYELDFTDNNEVIFRKVPQILSKVPVKEILSDILENMAGDINNIEEQILITTSCKAAVKANTYLNQYQMEEIIKNWRTCENPETCPHGRPIAKFFEHKDLAKFFMRNK